MCKVVHAAEDVSASAVEFRAPLLESDVSAFWTASRKVCRHVEKLGFGFSSLAPVQVRSQKNW